MAPDGLALELLVAAFAGGAFGAALGALPSFTFAGLLVVLGEVYRVAQRTLAPDAAPLGNAGLVDAIAFGVVFGPHVAFGGGAAAAAYAAKRGYLPTDTDYHPAKSITRGLGTRPDVLAVGGLFGVVGHLVATGSLTLGAPWDPVAFGVVVSAFVHRAALGYDLVGARSGLLDMSSGPLRADGGRSVEPWLPHMSAWSGVAFLGVVVGLLGGYVAYLTGSAFLAFGVSVVSVAFVNAGVEGFPVTHHITLPASTAVIAFVPLSGTELTPAAIAASVPLWQALALGAVFGLVGALAGELLQRLLYAHADTHLDPPAASIVVTSFLIAACAMLGFFAGSVWVPTP
jgi:hypothetical protein